MSLSLLYFIIPYYHQLPFPYYFIFFLYNMHRLLRFPYKSTKYKTMEILGVVTLYSYYIFHNIYISYIVTSFALCEFAHHDGLFIYFSTFLYAYLHHMTKESTILFLPFLYSSYTLSKSYYRDRKIKMSFWEGILSDVSQFYFLWYCSSRIDFRENYQC
jgi:hypothetical protein